MFKRMLGKFAAVAVSAALCISCVPAVIAEDETESPVKSVDPTPQIIYAALNDVMIDDSDFICEGIANRTLKYLDGEDVCIRDLFANEKGDLNDATLAKLLELVISEYGYSDFLAVLDEDSADGWDDEWDGDSDDSEIPDASEIIAALKAQYGDPLNILTLCRELVGPVYLVIDMFCEILEVEMPYETEDDFRAAVKACLVGEDSAVTVMDIVSLLGYYFNIDSESGTLSSYTQGEYIDMLSSVVTERGRYIEPIDGYNSVYEQLIAKRESMTAKEAFGVMTGLTWDEDGDLYYLSPAYNYTYHANGDIVRYSNMAGVVNEDGTLFPARLDYASLQRDIAMKEYYSFIEMVPWNFLDIVYTILPEESVMNFMNELYGDIVILTFDEYLEEYGSFFEDEGYTAAEIQDDYKAYTAACVESVHVFDAYGRMATPFYESGYYCDDDDTLVDISEVMEEDGTLLYPEAFGSAENIFDLLDAYIETLTRTDVPVAGDADGNGKLDVKDVIMMLKKIANWQNIDSDDLAADVDGDGKITVSDCVACLKSIAGWDIYLIG